MSFDELPLCPHCTKQLEQEVRLFPLGVGRDYGYFGCPVCKETYVWTGPDKELLTMAEFVNNEDLAKDDDGAPEDNRAGEEASGSNS